MLLESSEVSLREEQDYWLPPCVSWALWLSYFLPGVISAISHHCLLGWLWSSMDLFSWLQPIFSMLFHCCYNSPMWLFTQSTFHLYFFSVCSLILVFLLGVHPAPIATLESEYKEWRHFIYNMEMFRKPLHWPGPAAWPCDPLKMCRHQRRTLQLSFVMLQSTFSNYLSNCIWALILFQSWPFC